MITGVLVGIAVEINSKFTKHRYSSTIISKINRIAHLIFSILYKQVECSYICNFNSHFNCHQNNQSTQSALLGLL